jgi:uncharacterized phiE125 gp8 family phage protein
MVFKLVVGPKDDIISLDTARNWLRIDGHDEDAELVEILFGICQAAEVATGRALSPQVWDVVLDAFPCGAVRLPMPPVQSIESVTYIDSNGVSQPLLSTAWLLDADSEPGWLFPAYNTTWPSTRAIPNAVRIRVNCGYPLGGIPASIVLWIRAQLAHNWENRDGGLKLLPEVSGLLDHFIVLNIS